VVLSSNYLDGGGTSTSSVSTAVVLTTGDCPTCANPATMGRLRNNVLVGGAALARYGVYEEVAGGHVIHPVAVDNNDFWFTTTSSANYAYRSWNGSTGSDLPYSALGACCGS